MSKKNKTREITITDDGGTFTTIFKKFRGEKEYDFEGLKTVRRILSNQKAKLINTIKNKNPKSVYELAKILKRDFKSVNNDIKVLEKFGFIDMIEEKTGKRERLRPVIVVDSITLNIKL